MVIKMKKGTDVERHSGPANNILNIHIGISGLKGARLSIANETYSWEEGKVIAWDGSYDHAVDCVNCEERERVIMMVRYMHPDMSAAHFKGISDALRGGTSGAPVIIYGARHTSATYRTTLL